MTLFCYNYLPCTYQYAMNIINSYSRTFTFEDENDKNGVGVNYFKMQSNISKWIDNFIIYLHLQLH